MVTVADIFHHIAQELRFYSGADRRYALEEFIAGCIFDMHLAITTDFETTELNFLQRYGKGHTFYFRLRDYEHGKQLAGEMYFVMQGIHPNLDENTGEAFDPAEKLFLFVHLRSVLPPALVEVMN